MTNLDPTTVHGSGTTNTTLCNLGIRQAKIYDGQDTTTDPALITCEDCNDVLNVPAATPVTGADAVIDAFRGMTWI